MQIDYFQFPYLDCSRQRSNIHGSDGWAMVSMLHIIIYPWLKTSIMPVHISFYKNLGKWKIYLLFQSLYFLSDLPGFGTSTCTGYQSFTFVIDLRMRNQTTSGYATFVCMMHVRAACGKGRCGCNKSGKEREDRNWSRKHYIVCRSGHDFCAFCE